MLFHDSYDRALSRDDFDLHDHHLRFFMARPRVDARPPTGSTRPVPPAGTGSVGGVAGVGVARAGISATIRTALNRAESVLDYLRMHPFDISKELKDGLLEEALDDVIDAIAGGGAWYGSRHTWLGGSTIDPLETEATNCAPDGLVAIPQFARTSSSKTGSGTTTNTTAQAR